jgi:soluble lytic murein transglycosylase-like protein
MKTTIVAASLLMILSALAGSIVRYGKPDAPKPISVRILTEKDIKEGFKHDQKRKQIQRSIKAAEIVYRRNGCHPTYAEATGRIAIEYNIPARLLAAVVFVESSCNPNAVSDRYSVGLLQINPKYHHYSRAELKDPQRNLEIGASILAKYIRLFGLVEGLHAYNGFGNPTAEYSTKVLTAAGIKIEVKG